MSGCMMLELIHSVRRILFDQWENDEAAPKWMMWRDERDITEYHL